MKTDKTKAVFLDRDGTLVDEVGFLSREEDIKILPNTVEAIKLLRELGYLLVVVSNQSGVARGFLTEQRVMELNEEIFRKLEASNARPDMFFYCPHHPDATVDIYRVECECRKPKPGMIAMAQELIDIDLSRSISIGDKISDVQMCKKQGGKGILVLTGYGKSELQKAGGEGVEPDFVAGDLLDAALWIKKNLN